MKMITLPKLRDALRDLEPRGERGPGDRGARPRADRAHGRDHSRSCGAPCADPAPGARAGRTAGGGAATRSTTTQPAAPDGTPMCAAWVHDRYTVERGGRIWATWHPPVDPRYGCAFGHEHGSNPRAFAVLPAHGHARVRPDRQLRRQRRAPRRLQGVRGQRRPQGPLLDDGAAPGSGSPRRGHGALPLARDLAVRPRGRRLLAHTRGWPTSASRCPTAPAPASPPHAPAARPRAASPSTRSGPPRWTWAACSAPRPGFAIDNAITQFDPATPSASVFNKRVACGPHDPAGWDSYCKGDKRTVLRPRWVVRNRGPVALPHRRLRPPRRRRAAPGGVAPGARQPVATSAAGWRTPS